MARGRRRIYLQRENFGLAEKLKARKEKKRLLFYEKGNLAKNKKNNVKIKKT